MSVHRYPHEFTRVQGPKGLASMLKFQDALLRLLDDKPWREITVKEIATLAGMSPALVYTYYDHLDDLTLATADRLVEDGHPLPVHLAHVVALIRFEAERMAGAQTTRTV